MTLPLSMVRAASWMPAPMSGARPAVIRTAAALSRTTSRRGPCVPLKMSRRMAALVAASPPARASMGARVRSNCSGMMVLRVIWGARPGKVRTSAIWLGPEMESSSSSPGLSVDALVFAVDYEGVACAEQRHGVGDERNEVRGVDTHNLRRGSGGIAERAENVEDGADAERATDRHDGLHRRMKAGCVKEGEVVGAERGGGFVGGEPDGDAEGFEDVAGAAARGDGAVAVLGDGGSCSGGDESCSGGDVEGAAEVSAGAAGVGELKALGVVEREGSDGGAHRVDEAGDLGGGFATGCKRSEQRGELEVAELAGEDLLHERPSVFAGETFAGLHDALEVGMCSH